MKKCKNCGMEVGDPARFCPRCKSLELVGITAVPQQTQQFEQVQTNAPISEPSSPTPCYEAEKTKVSFCSTCGAKIENESSQFCHNCGTKIHLPASNNIPNQNNTPIYQPQQQPSTYTPPASAYAPAYPVAQLGMKWYNFLIYFLLFFSACYNLAYGIMNITGNIYFISTNGQATSEIVYNFYGTGLKVVDVITGILMIVIAAFAVYTRFRLAKYKANAPICICILYISFGVLGLFYNIAALAITGINEFATAIPTVIISVLLVIYNYNYFKKRKFMFVN